MGQALYRTYRSKKLSELVGQEHVTKALEHALAKGTMSHAYLFTGPRGVGKTSIARILAHEINGLPYTDDATHLDIIEIDAASNRRIDEIRDLRDKVHIAPTSAKYKVYIIDEVHMLTKEAFNALLKTLEEPPAHVVFILATTEAHKLPETIISRTQRFAFKPVDLPKVVAHLKHIAKQEKIDIADDALELVAAHGEGSFRDSISLLDQVRNRSGKVTLADVQASLGIAPAELIDSIVQALSAHDVVATAQHLRDMQGQGYEAAQVAKQLGQALRTSLLDGKPALAQDTLMHLLVQLVEVPASSDPRTMLEIALFDTAVAGAPSPVAPKAAAPTKVMPEQVQAKPPTQVEPHPSTFKKQADAAKEQTTPMANNEMPDQVRHNSDDAVLDNNTWPQVLAAIKQHHNTLYGIARMAHATFTPGELTLEIAYAFHQKRLNDKRNKEILATTITELTGQNIRITCTVGQGKSPDELAMSNTPPALPPADEVVHSVAKPKPVESTEENEAIKTVSNIFGGAELLES
ncbi:MAG TPA: DNA polymerase III subunit gamma/tau [Nevskiaceae bacterium]|nr:DNA polymerase III subunit gamma/tau [Nevskiaceae bacterium]